MAFTSEQLSPCFAQIEVYRRYMNNVFLEDYFI